MNDYSYLLLCLGFAQLILLSVSFVLFLFGVFGEEILDSSQSSVLLLSLSVIYLFDSTLIRNSACYMQINTVYLYVCFRQNAVAVLSLVSQSVRFVRRRFKIHSTNRLAIVDTKNVSNTEKMGELSLCSIAFVFLGIDFSSVTVCVIFLPSSARRTRRSPKRISSPPGCKGIPACTTLKMKSEMSFG